MEKSINFYEYKYWRGNKMKSEKPIKILEKEVNEAKELETENSELIQRIQTTERGTKEFKSYMFKFYTNQQKIAKIYQFPSCGKYKPITYI